MVAAKPTLWQVSNITKTSWVNLTALTSTLDISCFSPVQRDLDPSLHNHQKQQSCQLQHSRCTCSQHLKTREPGQLVLGLHQKTSYTCYFTLSWRPRMCICRCHTWSIQNHMFVADWHDHLAMPAGKDPQIAVNLKIPPIKSRLWCYICINVAILADAMAKYALQLEQLGRYEAQNHKEGKISSV